MTESPRMERSSSRQRNNETETVYDAVTVWVSIDVSQDQAPPRFERLNKEE